MKTCKRGEIWLVSFNPARGSEQKGTRPALIIQNDIGNKYSSTTIVAAISTKVTDYPQDVVISSNKDNGLKEKSCVKLGQILTIDKNRLIKRMGVISQKEFSELDYAIGCSLGTL
ncbi:type II toxin-antitoxin system PemK/MazF family toxin [Candidatus Gracilibacteria bacterium]|nr:type II toxin-antitoxin system PemK/MazF family toxin [Candidatus Gracilibacteria bacterium]